MQLLKKNFIFRILVNNENCTGYVKHFVSKMATAKHTAEPQSSLHRKKRASFGFLYTARDRNAQIQAETLGTRRRMRYIPCHALCT